MLKVSKESKFKTYRININGQVQGVGFRPMLYRLAKKLKIKGWIANSPSGAQLEVQSPPLIIKQFLNQTFKHLPKHAKIKSITKKIIKREAFSDFKIIKTIDNKDISAEIPPDLSICGKCLKELKSKTDRRHQYPFINCTNCGPRFAIVKKLPYDRPYTTMSEFKMCDSCQEEYDTPENRRFHAQPDACCDCGPEVELLNKAFKSVSTGKQAMDKCVSLLMQGKIIAIKGVGGYHLACSASNESAVKKLRLRKERDHKPFAVMARDIASVRKMCLLSKKEEKLITSPVRPIVLLCKKKGKINKLIAPGNAYLGVMLPYTPLHHLLFTINSPDVLIMTSGNLKDEPICRDEDQVKNKLTGIADYFLVHNREIHNRCDDSIIKPPVIIRRSRGIVPEPINITAKDKSNCILAAGAELKNTFCLTRGSSAYVSQYIGDLDNREALEFYDEAIKRFKAFLKVKPQIIAHDLHPDYLSTIYAKQTRIKTVAVQHHHAHIASVLSEKQLNKPVIGFAFDGVGYGLDGKIWGGECFFVRGSDFRRAAHFEYFCLPGGDAASKEIWRIAVSLLKQTGIKEMPAHLKKYAYSQIQTMIDKKINSPECCSVGRLFDGVSAIIGLRSIVTFEAQAAMELESVSLDIPVKKGYNFEVVDNVITLSDIIKGIYNDSRAGISKSVIGAKFHLTLADIICELSVRLRKKHKVNDVVLSGGVFQNTLLLKLAQKQLAAKKFNVHINELVPPNDGGISLGQAWIAGRCQLK